MKMLRYRRPRRLLLLHRHQLRLVVDLSLFLRAGPSSKPVSTGGEPQDESPHGVKRVGDEDAPAPSTPDAPGSDEADSEDKPTKEQRRLASTGTGERRAAWTTITTPETIGYLPSKTLGRCMQNYFLNDCCRPLATKTQQN